MDLWGETSGIYLSMGRTQLHSEVIGAKEKDRWTCEKGVARASQIAIQLKDSSMVYGSYEYHQFHSEYP